MSSNLSPENLAIYNEKLSKIPNREDVQNKHATEKAVLDTVDGVYNTLTRSFASMISLDAQTRHVAESVNDEYPELSRFNDKILVAKINGLIKTLNIQLPHVDETNTRQLLCSMYTTLNIIKGNRAAVSKLDKDLAAALKKIDDDEGALEKWRAEMTEPLKHMSHADFTALKRALGIPIVDEDDVPLFASLEDQFRAELAKNGIVGTTEDSCVTCDARTHVDRGVEIPNTKLTVLSFKSIASTEFSREYEVKNKLVGTVGSFDAKHVFGVARAAISEGVGDGHTFTITGYVIINLKDHEDAIAGYRDLFEFTAVDDAEEVIANFSKGKIECAYEEFVR